LGFSCNCPDGIHYPINCGEYMSGSWFWWNFAEISWISVISVVIKTIFLCIYFIVNIVFQTHISYYLCCAFLNPIIV
jgi:hypothetical protein